MICVSSRLKLRSRAKNSSGISFLVRMAMPNALRIFVNLAHPVEGHPVDFPLSIRELKRLRAVRREAHLLQRDQDDSVLRTVAISQLEVSLGELKVPPHAVK